MLIISNLEWGGVDCAWLSEKFGTPLYVFDEGIIKSRCREIRDSFLLRWGHENAAACYASKAFSSRAMAKLIKDEGLGLDVVSLGELQTALSVDFPASRIEMHGNAKSLEEISAAINCGIGRIIVDSEDEFRLVSKVSKQAGRVTKILLRVAPGVLAKTHTHIATGHTGSKFGFPIDGDMLPSTVSMAMKDDHIDLMGLHFHVGSQLFDPDDHICALEKTIDLMAQLKHDLGFTTRELNLGGGFGAVINPTVPHVPLEIFTDPMMKLLEEKCRTNALARPKAIIEPGRWIVSEAGITIYKVEVVKKLPGITYIAVNGGMADNPRYALYGAEYDAIAVKSPACSDSQNREKFKETDRANKISIVGKCCESGDILIDNAANRELEKLKPGDLVAVYNTGAYTFSMASNYNRLCRPAVVFVNSGETRLTVKRQTFDDLLSGDLI